MQSPGHIVNTYSLRWNLQQTNENGPGWPVSYASGCLQLEICHLSSHNLWTYPLTLQVGKMYGNRLLSPASWNSEILLKPIRSVRLLSKEVPRPICAGLVRLLWRLNIYRYTSIWFIKQSSNNAKTFTLIKSSFIRDISALARLSIAARGSILHLWSPKAVQSCRATTLSPGIKPSVHAEGVVPTTSCLEVQHVHVSAAAHAVSSDHG